MQPFAGTLTRLCCTRKPRPRSRPCSKKASRRTRYGVTRAPSGTGRRGFQLRYRAALALPVPVPVVLQFLVDHVLRTAPDGHLVCDLPAAIDSALVAGGFKVKRGAPALNTVMHRLAVLSKTHQVRDLANPVRDPAVQEVVRRIRRGHATRGVRPAAKTALTQDPLTAVLATCTDGLKGVRDRALLLFAWAAGAARRSPTP